MISMLNDFIAYKNCQSILCLNGLLPAADFFARKLPIIAADGAANQLVQMGLSPEAVIGDLDSLQVTLPPACQLIPDPDQSRNDFQKCLQYLQEQHLLPSLIVGVNGGYLDHILNNVNLFLHTESLLYAPPLIGFTVTGQCTLPALPVDTKLSLLGFPQAAVSSSGLKWELRQENLLFPGKTSCFNRTVADRVSIDVLAGTVLVLIYLEKTHDLGCHSREGGNPSE